MPENDPYLATNYNNVGVMYNELKKYKTALAYMLKAMKIGERNLRDNYQKLIQTYEEMDNNDKAFEYKIKLQELDK